ncbi:MAG: CotH kinase family protein [Chitinophagales bacterium]|nr:CotH kinase family protein [Chitinophagales bacterium]
MRITVTIICGLICHLVHAQTFYGTGSTIPDDGTAIQYPIEITGLPDIIDTTTFGLEMVCVNLTHTWDSDLDIRLIAPDGTSILLTTGNGGDGDNYTNTCFTNNAGESITSGYAPFTGEFKPQGQMGLVNNGQNPNGTWNLYIYDTYPFADTGELLDWNITFGNDPAVAFTLHSSNLPIVIINTNSQLIVNDPRIDADMGIIDNGPGEINYPADSFNNYDGKISIELRGSSSLGFPQKSFAFETQDSLGENLNVSLLGMPAENDWILYAPYDDKSFMRNSLTYQLSNEMGQYASRCIFCEVIINNEYQGVYVLMEKIKRDNDRVDIAQLTSADLEGDALTGGYIIKIDWVNSEGWYSEYLPDQTATWNNSIFYQYVYPVDDSIKVQQRNYIQNYVDSFETGLDGDDYMDTLIGWRQYMDEISVIDYFILNELSKNVDGYRLSTFLYKDRNSNGGKLYMGPVWDYNLAWHNADYCGNELVSGWAYAITDYCATDLPFWWRKLVTDTLFINNLQCRWQELRETTLKEEHIFNYIDSIETLVDEAKDRHYTVWPILGIYVWPNPYPLAETYAEEIVNLKTWIAGRLTWLDESIPGMCYEVAEDTTVVENIFDQIFPEIQIYPNPVSDVLHISIKNNTENVYVEIINIAGEKMIDEFISATQNTLKIDLQEIPRGVYQIRIIGESGSAVGVNRFVKN